MKPSISRPQTDMENALSFFIDEVLLFWETESLLKTGLSRCDSEKPSSYKRNKNIGSSKYLQKTELKLPQTDFNKIVSDAPKIPIIKKQGRDHAEITTNWQLHPLLLDDSAEDFLKIDFKCLKYQSTEFLRVPAAVILHSPSSPEILFFQRLTKSVTQFLFSCRLLVLNEKTANIKTHLQKHEIILLNHEKTSKLFDICSPHEPRHYHGTTIIPIFSYEHYQEDPQAKKQLWMQLNQLNTSATPKS